MQTLYIFDMLSRPIWVLLYYEGVSWSACVCDNIYFINLLNILIILINVGLKHMWCSYFCYSTLQYDTVTKHYLCCDMCLRFYGKFITNIHSIREIVKYGEYHISWCESCVCIRCLCHVCVLFVYHLCVLFITCACVMR